MIKILSISSACHDYAALQLALSGIRSQIVRSDSCSRASELLERHHFSIIVSESKLPDGTWRDVLSAARKSSAEPVLIVTSHCADVQLWAEVLNLGGFDVISKPFDKDELRHVLETACLGQMDGQTQTGARVRTA